MSMNRPEGFFARLWSLITGIFQRWVRDREHDSPEVVYEQAIGERVRQYRELKSAVAGILYLRAKLESEISDRRAEIARLHDDARRAVRRQRLRGYWGPGWCRPSGTQRAGLVRRRGSCE